MLHSGCAKLDGAAGGQEPPSTIDIDRMALWAPAPVDQGAAELDNAFITVYHPAKTNGAAVIICPGGGYGPLVAGPEGHDIARWLNQHNILAVVLEYRLPQGRSFLPLHDAQRAIRTVRSKAREWNIGPQRIGIMGFSAGGHLASTCATHFDSGDPKAIDPLNRFSSRPDFAILIYPVITMGPQTHYGSKQNLLGQEPNAELVDLFSNEKQVTDQTPPTFLAHAVDDDVVSPENSKMFFEALQAHDVPVRYLELPSGSHGLNGYTGPMWEAWKTQSLQWLTTQQIIPQKDNFSKK